VSLRGAAGGFVVSLRSLVCTVSITLAVAACGDDTNTGPKDTTGGGDSTTTTNPDGSDVTTPDDVPDGSTTSPDVPDGSTTSPDAPDATTTETVGDTIGDTIGDTDVEPPQGCEDPIPAAPQGQVCGVVSGNQSALLIRADLILPNGILERGQLLVVDGYIACTGCDCVTAPQAAGATVFNCPDAVVSPGLINAHDHITYDQGKPIAHGTRRWNHRNEWRTGANRLDYDTNPDDNGEAWGEMRQVMAGTTSLFGSGSGIGMLRNVDVASRLEGLQHGVADYDVFPLGSSGMPTSGCGSYDLPNANIAQGKVAYVPHVSEGINVSARNELLCLDGQQQGGLDIVEDNVAFIHGIGATAADIALFVANGGSLVWSPRSNTDLYGFTAEAPLYHKLGGLVGLGTDWTFSGSVNMLRELQCAEDWNARWDHYFSDQQLVNMATSWAAATLGFEDVLGSIAVGKVADLAIWDARDNAGYRAILDAEVDDVVLVMRGGPPPLLDGNTQFRRGRPLYGDPALVDALQDRAIRFTNPPACDTLDVCGRSKKFCVAEQLGPTLGLDAVRASLNASYTYGLFFCGVPDNEPSCVPARTNEFTGAMTQSDPDGDNLAGVDDNCPTWFNAVRPLDGGKQPDTDGDGEGDVCDPCPFDADSTACSSVDPDDIDGDGVLNALDKCPSIPDDQTDTDGDGIGNACDLCPEESNLGGKPCSSTIYKVKDGTVPVNSPVALSGVVCTVVGPDFFTVQVKDAPAPEFSALYVFRGSAGTKCTPGTLVDLQGTVQDYFGQIQLGNATWVVAPGSSPVPVPAPAVILPADAAVGGAKAKAYEALLVEVKNVTVTSTTPVAETQGTATENVTGEFIVTGNLRVDDQLYAITPAPTVGQIFPALRGVLRYAWNKNKLLPRSIDDIIAGPPELVGIEPASGAAMYVGDVGGPFVVRLNRAAEGPTNVTVTSGDESKATVVATATVASGQTTAPVVVTALGATESVTLTAKLGTDGPPKTATLRIVPAGTVPAVIAVEAQAKVYVGDDFDVTVTLDLPAPTGGQAVTLAADPTGLLDGSLPALTVAAGQRIGTVTLTAGDTAGTVEISASTTAGEASAEVEISDAAPTAEVLFCFENATGYSAAPNIDTNTTAASTFTASAGLTGTDDAAGATPRPAACTGANNRAPNRSGWPQTAARDANKYFQIKVAHAAGTYVLEFDIRSSNTGPKKYDIVSSTGGTLVTGGDYTGATAFQHITWTGALPEGTNDIRIYGYGATAAGGTFRIDNIHLSPAP